MTVNGAAYALPTWEPAMAVSASSSLPDGGTHPLLLTPVASEAEKATFLQTFAQRSMTGQPFLTNQIRDIYDLNQEIQLLKTPTSQLAANGGSQHPDKRREGGHGPTLADEVEHLLPTPVAQPSGNTPENHLRKKPGRQTVTDLAILVENDMIGTGGKLLAENELSTGESTSQRSSGGNESPDGQPPALPNPPAETEPTD
jgi:hypothetical protein